MKRSDVAVNDFLQSGDVDGYAAYMQEDISPTVDVQLLREMRDASHDYLASILKEKKRALEAFYFVMTMLLFEGALDSGEVGKVPRWLNDVMADFVLEERGRSKIANAV